MAELLKTAANKSGNVAAKVVASEKNLEIEALKQRLADEEAARMAAEAKLARGLNDERVSKKVSITVPLQVLADLKQRGIYTGDRYSRLSKLIVKLLDNYLEEN